MAKTAIEEVLANWIAQATSPVGRFAKGVDPAEWVAAQFMNRWRSQVGGSIEEAELAISRAREELMAFDDRIRLERVLHELIHIEDALGEIRSWGEIPSDLDSER